MVMRAKRASDDALVDVRAIKACLDELGDHATANGLLLAANLIGAASRAIADEMVEQKMRRQVRPVPRQSIYNA
jgi:hypothetical protein